MNRRLKKIEVLQKLMEKWNLCILNVAELCNVGVGISRSVQNQPQDLPHMVTTQIVRHVMRINSLHERLAFATNVKEQIADQPLGRGLRRALVFSHGIILLKLF